MLGDLGNEVNFCLSPWLKVERQPSCLLLPVIPARGTEIWQGETAAGDNWDFSFLEG